MTARHACAGLAVLLALSAGAARASGSPVGDELAFVVAWMGLGLLLSVASVGLAIRRARLRGARSGWLYLGGVLLTLPVGGLLSLALLSSPLAAAWSAPWRLLLACLLPTLLLWLAFLAAVHADDQREENRAWKATR